MAFSEDKAAPFFSHPLPPPSVGCYTDCCMKGGAGDSEGLMTLSEDAHRTVSLVAGSKELTTTATTLLFSQPSSPSSPLCFLWSMTATVMDDWVGFDSSSSSRRNHSVCVCVLRRACKALIRVRLGRQSKKTSTGESTTHLQLDVMEGVWTELASLFRQQVKNTSGGGGRACPPSQFLD